MAADRQFHAADDPASPDRLARLREALIGPLREVYPSRLFPDASLCKNAMAKKGQVGGEPWRPSPLAAEPKEAALPASATYDVRRWNARV